MNTKFVIFATAAAGGGAGGTYFGGSVFMGIGNIGGYVQPAVVILSGPRDSSTGRPF